MRIVAKEIMKKMKPKVYVPDVYTRVAKQTDFQDKKGADQNFINKDKPLVRKIRSRWDSPSK